ncbi:MAG: DUF512 domain-containing protein [Lachnospiraceae bacterium]|nr:DUF512 domain-containing protein [Lachnospiraceae bacterium]
MRKTYAHQIKSVASGSIGEELELEPGDKILEINGEIIEDILDYRYYIQNEEISMVVEKKDGTQVDWEFDKELYEDLGIEFESGLMSDYRSCTNQCIFCFIDQMPPGMRETLYFKDDDARLSFLQGNYITMTNMKQHDLDRIVKYHLSPINISVQTTNPELRCMMLHNRFAGDIMEKMQMLKEAGIEMNGQIVLCKGVNDGKELARSLRDLAGLYPQMESVSVVPVGLSKYRDGLYPLEPLTKEDAENALAVIEEIQREMYDQHGTHFVHASDEFYLLAERDLPEEECYDGYVQLENGVGMLRLLIEETSWALEEMDGDDRVRTISLATGKLAYPYLFRIAEQVMTKFPGIRIHVYAIRNEFFGETITVSGLITGTDLKEQLKDRELGDVLLLPANMFRSGEEVFLDDISCKELENALQVPINIVKSDGQDLILAMIGEERENGGLLHSPYEQEG